MGAMMLAIRPTTEESLTRFSPSRPPGPGVGQVHSRGRPRSTPGRLRSREGPGRRRARAVLGGVLKRRLEGHHDGNGNVKGPSYVATIEYIDNKDIPCDSECH